MRYYLDMDKPVGHAAKLHKIASAKKIKRSVMYAKDGIYFYDKGVLHKHKLQFDDKTLKEDNYIGRRTLYPVDIKIRQDKMTYRLPVEHSIGVVVTTSYKLTPRSSLTFIVEENNGKLTNYYFESKGRPREIRAEISSFLSALK